MVNIKADVLDAYKCMREFFETKHHVDSSTHGNTKEQGSPLPHSSGKRTHTLTLTCACESRASGQRSTIMPKRVINLEMHDKVCVGVGVLGGGGGGVFV